MEFAFQWLEGWRIKLEVLEMSEFARITLRVGFDRDG